LTCTTKKQISSPFLIVWQFDFVTLLIFRVFISTKFQSILSLASAAKQISSPLLIVLAVSLSKSKLNN